MEGKPMLFFSSVQIADRAAFSIEMELWAEEFAETMSIWLITRGSLQDNLKKFDGSCKVIFCCRKTRSWRCSRVRPGRRPLYSSMLMDGSQPSGSRRCCDKRTCPANKTRRSEERVFIFPKRHNKASASKHWQTNTGIFASGR